jgi:endonuclease YncB( thermonuclease family)
MAMSATKKRRKNKYYNEILSYEVVDGDTIRAVLDLGYSCYKNVTIRLVGMDTPELKSNNPLEQEAANLSKQVISKMLQLAWDGQVDLESESVDVYGRPLGRIYLHKFKCDLAQTLINLKAARYYPGSIAKNPWSSQSLSILTENCNKFLQDPMANINKFIAERFEVYPGMGC